MDMRRRCLDEFAPTTRWYSWEKRGCFGGRVFYDSCQQAFFNFSIWKPDTVLGSMGWGGDEFAYSLHGRQFGVGQSTLATQRAPDLSHPAFGAGVILDEWPMGSGRDDGGSGHTPRRYPWAVPRPAP